MLICEMRKNVIHKNQFDAALIPNFREALKADYNKLIPFQEELTLTLSKELSNSSVWQTRNCPICVAIEDKALPSHKYPCGMNIIQCHICSFTYSMQVLNPECDKQYYSSTSAYDIYLRLKNHPLYQKLEQTKAQYIVQVANQFTEKKGMMLDIGSGTGSLVLEAKNEGWNATGIEANPTFIEESLNKNLKIIQGFFPEAMQEIDLHSYNFISMLDVLEHLVNPVEFLRLVKQYLSSAGILLIQVPNLNSLLIRLDGEKNNNFCIGHWSYFTPATLDKVLQQVGFEQIFLETYISEFDKIQKFAEVDICRVVQELTGKSVDMNQINIDWLHEHLLGYKIFGVYKVAV